MSNPMHQFEIQPIVEIPVAGLDLSFTNSSLWMAVGVIISTTFFTLAMRKKSLVPGKMQMVAESVYEFIASMIRENIGTEGKRYFPLIFTLFIVVFLGNALGLIPGPWSFTYTSHLIVTGTLAAMIFLSVVVIGIFRHGLHFFSIFLPAGVPWWLSFIIVPIELISFLARPVTLSVRLFANMVAGHVLMKVIAGFGATLMGLGIGGYALGILPVLFNTIIIGFELLIAFLQAYVFTILSCIYLKDTIEIGH